MLLSLTRYNNYLNRLVVRKQLNIPSSCTSSFSNSRYWLNRSSRELELESSCCVRPQRPRTTTQDTTSTATKKNDHLYVSGGAYLIPTLRLGRNDTPQSVDSLLEEILVRPDPTIRSNHPIQSLLRRQRRPKQSTVEVLGGEAKSWMVPITLDLSELLPDGSPHHSTPISLETIQGFVHVLLKYHIAVVGLVHVPYNDNHHPNNLLEHFAAILGIPTLLPIHRRATPAAAAASKSSIRGSDTIALQDLAQWITFSIVQYTHPINDNNNNDSMHNRSANNVPSSFHASTNEEYDVDITKVVHTRRSIQQAIHSTIVEQLEQNGSVNMQDLNTTSSTTNSLQQQQQLKQKQQQAIPTNKIAPSVATTTTSTFTTTTASSSSSKVVYGHVRSGQIVSSDNPYQSLVIVGDVHSGGEVLSDGDIHIYGKLQGRAIAGVLTSEARIYVRHFDPELICIHGIYTTIDNVSLLPCVSSTTTETSCSMAFTGDETSSSFLKPGDAVIVSLSSTLKQLQYKRM